MDRSHEWCVWPTWRSTPFPNCLDTGETWNVMKIGYQLKQVRERLAEGLVDKGILRTEKRNFLLFDMATHPIADMAVKDEIIKRVATTLVSRTTPASFD